jgi:long-chain acyl-CoA synthetase
MSVGAVTVPVDKELPAEDLLGIFNTAECSMILYSPAVEAKIMSLKDQIPTLKTLICMGETETEALKINDVIADGARRFEEGDHSYYTYEIDPDRLASIVFTSGTTGKGKGVMLSQTNICSDMTQGMYNFAITERTMCLLPPHHTFGSTVNFVGHFAQGSMVYITSGLRYMMQEIKEVKPTHLVLVPLFVETIYKRIWATAEKTGKAGLLRKMMKVSNAARKIGIDARRKLFSSVLSVLGGELQMIICGGAALNQDIIDTFDALGITILNGYGITECAPLISCNRNRFQKKGSVGVPIIGEQVKIADPDENGEGEICVKGPNVMMGYYKNPEATAAAFDEEGYFKTGDYGKLDEEGWIYITGRLKNLIIFSNGKNVYPEEIETEISRIRGVGEVVVYAGESKINPKKEVIVAEIYPDSEALERHNITDAQAYFDDAIKKINAKNVSYKHVGKVKIRGEEFPKNTSRKITRFAIDKSID